MITKLQQVLALATALVTASPAWAQAPAPPPPAASRRPAAPPDRVAQASEHFTRGVKLYQEDDFRAALIEFNRAYEIAPNWAVLYDIGQAQYQLRDYAAALRTLDKYVEQGGDSITSDRRAQVDHEMAELRGRVAHLTVVANVGDVDVALDDAPLGKASADILLLIGAGRHKLTASRPGFLPATKVVDVAGGDTVTIRMDLAPVAPLQPVAHEPPNYAGAAILGAVGLVGVAVGTIFGVTTINDKTSLDSQCGSTKTSCPPSAQGDIDAYSRNGTISGIGFGVGAVGLVVGGYFFLRARSKNEPVDGRITPWLGPGAGGLSGTF